MLNALIAMRLENMNGFTQLVERLKVDAYLRYVCGFEIFGITPSVATFSRFYSRLVEEDCLEILFSSADICATSPEFIQSSTCCGVVCILLAKSSAVAIKVLVIVLPGSGSGKLGENTAV
ncbi:MAG TPA: transposase [Gelria sp.]|nr:transposase [Gelria sp.]